MDEFNNDRNPFDEQRDGTNADENGNPYAQQNADPYNQQMQQNNNNYAQQNDPYNQQSPQNGNPYAQQSGDIYNHQPQQNANPYNQPNQGYVYNRQNIPQQGYVQPQGYAQQGYGVPYQPYTQQSTGMATASLILGIISIVLCIPALGFHVLFLVPIVGLILGIVYKTKRLPVGKGLSTAGIITSAIGLVLPIVFLIAFSVWLVANGPELMDYLRQNYPEYYEVFYDQFNDTFPEWFESVLHFIFK